ncbi:MAG: papain-like cysteine protease family protein [Ruminococcus sp.]|nr:papain-like cysteine protease family protein [Ruminococcus sp.]
MTQIIKLTIVVCLLVLLCFVIIAPIIIFIQEAREAKKSHEPRTITPENNSDGEANEFNNELDHINSKYYIHHDFYNLKSQESLHIISYFLTYQQTTEYTCGGAVAMMVLHYYDDFRYDEFEISKMVKTDIDKGTSPENLALFFMGIGYEVESHTDTVPKFETIEDFQKYLIMMIDNEVPVMVDWTDWGGHWQVIIGIDTCDTDDPYDDVLIMADPYDVTDHNKDGYFVVPLGRFFYMWREGICAHKSNPYEQPFVVAKIKKEVQL